MASHRRPHDHDHDGAELSTLWYHLHLVDVGSDGELSTDYSYLDTPDN